MATEQDQQTIQVNTGRPISFIRYVGSKISLSKQLAGRLQATGSQTLVDVFGGSASVLLNSGFIKRVWNDKNGDLVNLFRVMADEYLRGKLFFRLSNLPLCRQVFEDDYHVFLEGGYSFARIKDPVERARATFYRQSLCFGGKQTTGGFQISTLDRTHIKELSKYRNVLKAFDKFGRFFRDTIIEHMDATDLVQTYSRMRGIVFFVDPPYPGCREDYYATRFPIFEHTFLAEALRISPHPVICTFYDHPIVRDLYPEDVWEYEVVQGRKNIVNRLGPNCVYHDEWILTKRAQFITQTRRAT